MGKGDDRTLSHTCDKQVLKYDKGHEESKKGWWEVCDDTLCLLSYSMLNSVESAAR